MANATAKSIAIIDKLVDVLKLRFSTKTIKKSFHTDGWPYLTLDDGSAATNELNFVIKCEQQSWPLAKDAFGNTAIPYGPHIIKVLSEASSTGTTEASKFLVWAECCKLAAKTAMYQNANGAAPSITDLDDENDLKATFEDMYWKMMVSQ